MIIEYYILFLVVGMIIGLFIGIIRMSNIFKRYFRSKMIITDKEADQLITDILKEYK
jgi:uncharacterized protein YneF (UPF0154 family)